MAQIYRTNACFTIRVKHPVFEALKNAETDKLNYRKLAQLAIARFVENGGLDELTNTEKAA
jgi:hypothetical protein